MKALKAEQRHGEAMTLRRDVGGIRDDSKRTMQQFLQLVLTVALNDDRVVAQVLRTDRALVGYALRRVGAGERLQRAVQLLAMVRVQNALESGRGRVTLVSQIKIAFIAKRTINLLWLIDCDRFQETICPRES